MYTNTTRITGLSGSGIDTDAMVEKLMYAESSKLYRYQRSVSWKTWQQEAYRNVIKKFQDFQSKWISSIGTSTSLKYSSAFASFKNSVKSSKGGESDAITINKSTSSKKYEISVEKLAQSDTYVSDTSKGKSIEGTADVAALAARLQNGGEFSMNVALDGKSKTITISKDDFISASGSDNAEKIENALNAKLEKAFGKEDGNLKVSVEIGSGNSFALKANLGHEVTVGSNGTNKNSIYNSEDATSGAKASDFKDAEGTFRVTVGSKSYDVTIDSNTVGNSIADKINNALKSAVATDGSGTEDLSKKGILSASIQDDRLVLSAGQEAVDIVVTSSGSGTKGLAPIMGAGSTISLEGANDLKNFFGISSGSNKISNTTSLGDIFTGIWDANGEATISLGDADPIKITKDTNFATFLEKINSSDAGVKISYNQTSQKYTLESKESGEVNKIKIGNDQSTETVFKAMGFDISGGVIDEAQHTKVAQDAVLTIDGIKTTRTSNNIELDGMDITLNKVTEAGETITLGNETDVDGIYETISKFVEEYNTLIGDLNKQVSERIAKSDDYSYYEPLTDQEKKEMDEDEIKLWEEKAKTGLIYRDSTITGVLQKMRTAMYSSYTKEDGSKIAMYNFGITTSSEYTDNGKLVIDEDKLKKAISENLDDIQSLFTGKGIEGGKGLVDNLEGVINSAIGTKGALREKAGIEGTASVNNNTFSNQIKDLNEKIRLEKERLVEKENRYYLLFSSMESSIMNSNSQLDALFSMLGQ